MQEELNESYSKYFNKKTIKRGIVIFLIITLATFAVIFIYNDGIKNLKVWKELDPRFFAIGLLFVGVDLLLGGYRNHIFVREFVSDISWKVSFRANLANMFMGAVTPGQSGGGPAQWYYFLRNGVSIKNSVGVSFYNWISTLIFFPISGAMALYVLKDRVPEGFVVHLTEFAFSIFSTLLIVICVALFAPKVIYYLIQAISRFIGFLKPSWSKKLADAGNKGVDKLVEYRELYIGLIKKKPYLMLYSFFLTVILYANKYILAYVFVIAFGATADFWSIMGVMAVSYLLLYFAPSPGGSGIAELGMTALLTPIIGEELAPSITLLHRSFLVFIPAIIGSTVMFSQLSKEK